MQSQFMQAGQELLAAAWDHTASLPSLPFTELPPERSAAIVVDMVRGFAETGALSSPRVGALAGDIALFCRRAQAAGMQLLLFADEHSPHSPEFSFFPPHCIEGTAEAEIIPALAAFGPVIPKNSTNGLLEPLFMAWLDEHQQLDHFVVMGDCTDICVLQFAATLKALFNRLNRVCRVIVPAKLTDTYDAPGHNGDVVKALSLLYLSQMGVEVIEDFSPGQEATCSS